MEPRLASSVLVGALIRRAEAEGGFAAVLARGDATAGSVLVVLAQRGRKERICERILDATGRYAWQSADSRALVSDEEFNKFLARRRSFDPDGWVLELDIASVERFAAEMIDFG